MLRLSKVCHCCIPIALTLVSLLAVQPIGASTIGPTVAYVDPADVGNQLFTGSLGQNFTVNGAITVSQLGVFDSGQNGINGTLTVAIFSSNGSEVVGPLTFSGTAGTVISGDRFLTLPAPVTLGPGNYSLTTAGWGLDMNGNANIAGFTPPTLNTGGGLITFTGSGFLAGGGLQFLTPAPGLTPDQFNAGSFVFAPEPSTAILLAVGLLLVLIPGLRRQPTK